MSIMWKAAIAAGVLGVVGSAQAADTITVFVIDFDFVTNGPGGINPPVVINVGDTVRWEFNSDFHTTTAAAGLIESWDSGLLNTGDVFEHTFTNQGVFPYYCAIHGFDNGDGTVGGMASQITVIPAPGIGAAGGIAAVALMRRRRPTV